MDDVNVSPDALLPRIEHVAIPVPFLGTVNAWLLAGSPLTLVDTGPANAESLDALEAGLRGLGVAVEEIELVLLTHHHLDHTGLAGAVAERSGAAVACTAETAAWGERYHERAALERHFGRRLLADHGVPDALIESSEPFWEHIARNGAGFATSRVLAEGEVIVGGGRRLRVIERPGHSTSDTLFVDDATGVALVGDHLLAEITPGAEVVPVEPAGESRRAALPDYLRALRLTAEMPLGLLLTGHGPAIADHRRLIAARLAFHEERLRRVGGLVEVGGTTSFEIAVGLFGREIAETQAVLALWEVIGHLDVLAERGLLTEAIRDDGIHLFHPAVSARLAAARSI